MHPANDNRRLLQALDSVRERAARDQVQGLFLGAVFRNSSSVFFHAGDGDELLTLARRAPRALRAKPSTDEPAMLWIWCDVLGDGPRWELALQLAEDVVFFPRIDFEDCLDDFADCPRQSALPPTSPPAEPAQ